MRFPIAISPWFRPLLLPLGASRSGSFVDIDEGELHARFGPLFDERIPLTAIAAVEPAHWPLLGGIGWRTNFVGSIGLVGTPEGVVRIRLKAPRRVRMLLLPLRLRDLFVSLEKPADFVEALRQRISA